MSHARCDAYFLRESLAHRLETGPRAQDLDGDVAAMSPVMRAVHDGASANAKDICDPQLTTDDRRIVSGAVAPVRAIG
jgi:hypothetical protein